MATTVQHWRDRAIEKSQGITDAWEVTKSYAGRVAEWVLFLCMVVNIVEMLPGVELAPLFSNIVLGVQVVMLDVGGFSLASMADHARRMGDEKAARRASRTGWFLIILMMVTLLLVAIAVLFPETKTFIGNLEKALILVRVVMTVMYGHVIHSLRGSSHAQVVATQNEQIQTLSEQFTQQISQLTEGFTQREQLLLAQIAGLATRAQEKEQEVAATLLTMQEAFQQQVSALQEQQAAQQNGNEESNEDDKIVDISVYRNPSTDPQQNGQQQEQQKVSKPVNRSATKNATKVSTPAKQKAQQIIKKNPGLSAPELAKKAGISRQYASKILADLA